MKKISILLAASLMLSFASAPAYADPERAYQGGKAAAGLSKVDDRGAEERVRDFLTEKGRQHGSSSSNSGDNSRSTPKPSPSRASREP